MGCDIHGWVEVRPYDFDKDYWKSMVNIDHLERNYQIFGRMFGVRMYEENFTPIAPERGQPLSSKYYVKGDEDSEISSRDRDYEHWDLDAHSMSWISLKEIMDNEERILKPKEGYSFDSKFAMLFRIMKELGKEYGIDNVRLVVWFDN